MRFRPLEIAIFTVARAALLLFFLTVASRFLHASLLGNIIDP